MLPIRTDATVLTFCLGFLKKTGWHFDKQRTPAIKPNFQTTKYVMIVRTNWLTFVTSLNVKKVTTGRLVKQLKYHFLTPIYRILDFYESFIVRYCFLFFFFSLFLFVSWLCVVSLFILWIRCAYLFYQYKYFECVLILLTMEV
jgi:hypothetical protein